ncbi:MAG: cytochrome c oxidase subunit II [Gammaproteobacteria bacterium]|nr:cytochrome c oxidase subunit II [Pseudomonadales bacterium]MCP5330200.1 cytochrome c oxidase subunit II [Pseudomonadales bacterium]
MLPKAKLWLALTVAALSLLSTNLQAAWELNMPRGVTQTSREIYDLHMQIIWWCVAIGVVVFGVMLWSTIKYRKSKGAVPANFHESTKVEIIWTIIPFVILILMAVPATQVLTEAYDASESDLDIQITGYQWRWEYRYLRENADEEEVSFFSNLATSREEINNQLPKQENYLLEVDNALVIPVNKKVRFLITSNDVIHAWWVPDFAVKKDAIPGFINEAWTVVEEPGIYRGQCAELCGIDHGFMPVVVHALPQDEYDAWYAGRQEQARAAREQSNNVVTMSDSLAMGEEIYNRTCIACHQAGGAGLAPAFPALAGSSVVNGDLTANIQLVMNGVPGTAMASYARMLSPVELAAIVTYIRNSFGNSTGDLVQPSEVNALLEAQ